MPSSSSAPLYSQALFQELMQGAWRPGGVELTQHGLQVCAFMAGDRVADVGCGGGATLQLLQARGVQTLGLDIAPLHEHGPMLRANAAHLPLAARSLDGIVCECVLSLLPEQDAVLAGFARVLRSGGVLLLSDIFVRDGQCAPPHSAQQSCTTDGARPRHCMDGARPRHCVDAALEKAGLSIKCFEDHSALLRPLAAQLLWHGLACTGHGGAAWGYGLWIAVK